MNRLACWISIAVLAMCGLGNASEATAQAPGYRARLDSLFTVLEVHDRMMGTVTVRRAGRVVYQRSLGASDSAHNGWRRADEATMYRVGSVTKPLTAAMIYQLVDEGRLTLDTRLSRFFPALPGADAITLRDLLGHTSGLHEYAVEMDPAVPLTRDSLLRRIAARPPQFAPGTARRYSNSNYLLLGYILEDVTASSYAEQLRRRIATRVGLRRTRVGGAVRPERNEARSYYFADGHWALQPDQAPENAGGAGAIVSTTADLTRFLAALFERGLISADGVREMTNGFVDGERRSGKGLSPFSIPGAGRRGFSHDGSTGAFTALVGYVPDDSLALALTINGHNYPQNRIFFHVWDILYGVARPLPGFTLVPLTEVAAAALPGVYAADAYGLTITVRRVGTRLEAQTEGQAPFPLVHIGQNRFVHEHEGILIEFAEPIDGVAPGFTLFQQRVQIPLVRRRP